MVRSSCSPRRDTAVTTPRELRNASELAAGCGAACEEGAHRSRVSTAAPGKQCRHVGGGLNRPVLRTAGCSGCEGRGGPPWGSPWARATRGERNSMAWVTVAACCWFVHAGLWTVGRTAAHGTSCRGGTIGSSHGTLTSDGIARSGPAGAGSFIGLPAECSCSVRAGA